MSVWLTAEGKPFFAGTYYPKYRLLQLLRRIQEIWSGDRAPLLADGDRLLESVRNLRESEAEDGQEADWEEILGTYIGHFQFHFDEKHGGFGRAPKFPQTMNLMLMMRQDSRTQLHQAESMVTKTLGAMVRGGIYDHLRGGFHRYSVDEKWLVPHFEKMLYDQALLTSSLIEASQIYRDPELARAARETCDYVLREMTDPAGGFYSAQDADSLDPESRHMEEGHFATYSYAELEKALTAEELQDLRVAYGVKPQGDFEGRSILHLQEGADGSAKERPALQSAFRKLETLRSAKPKPHLDDKVIAAWNGWMIAALARAGAALGESRFVEAAQKALKFAREALMVNGELKRFWRAGEARANATAEDYASLIHACLELHQIDFSKDTATWALALQERMDQKFWSEEDGMYYSSDGKDPLVPLRLMDDYDGVSPSSNSMAALNLERLYLFTGDRRYRAKSDRLFAALFAKFKRYPSGLPFLGLAMDFRLAGSRVAVLKGAEGWVEEFRLAARRKFMPHVLWTRDDVWPVGHGKSAPGVYVCEEGQCLAPAQSAPEADRQLRA